MEGSNTTSISDFIEEYIQQYPKTKTCLNLIQVARAQWAKKMSKKSEEDYILEYVNKKLPNSTCTNAIIEAILLWRDMASPSVKPAAAAKPNTKAELKIMNNIKKLELGLGNMNIKNLVRGARNLPPAGSAASYAAPPAKSYRRGVHDTPQRPNPFPDVNPSFISTIDYLNRFIEERFSGSLGNEEERTRWIGLRVGSVHTNFQAYEFAKYFLMFSSSNNSDCLLHTFLTSTCPAFRRLSQEDKDTVANWVRLYLVPAFPVFQQKLLDQRRVSQEKRESREWLGGETLGEELKLRFFSPGKFLDDTDIDILKDIFNISILVFENQVGSPQTVALLGSSSPVYMFMNKAGAHYEAVKTSDNSYTISLRAANKIVLVIKEPIIKESVQDMSSANSIRTTMNSQFGIRLGDSNSADTLKTEVNAKLEEVKRELRSIGPAPNFSNQTRRNNKKPKLSFKMWLKTPEAKGLLAAGIPERNLEASYTQKGGRGTRKAGYK